MSLNMHAGLIQIQKGNIEEDQGFDNSHKNNASTVHQNLGSRSVTLQLDSFCVTPLKHHTWTGSKQQGYTASTADLPPHLARPPGVWLQTRGCHS